MTSHLRPFPTLLKDTSGCFFWKFPAVFRKRVGLKSTEAK